MAKFDYLSLLKKLSEGFFFAEIQEEWALNDSDSFKNNTLSMSDDKSKTPVFSPKSSNKKNPKLVLVKRKTNSRYVEPNLSALKMLLELSEPKSTNFIDDLSEEEIELEKKKIWAKIKNAFSHKKKSTENQPIQQNIDNSGEQK